MVKSGVCAKKLCEDMINHRPTCRFSMPSFDYKAEPGVQPVRPSKVPARFSIERHMEKMVMQSAIQTASVSKKTLWVGRIFSALVVLFMLVDSVVKVIRLAPAVEGTVQLGYPASVVFGIGLTALICTVLYAVPRTAILGAILLTGYLGGAVATHVRVGNPLFSHVLFPVYLGVLAWAGLYLRYDRLRTLFPLRR